MNGLPECFPFDSIKAYLMKPPVLMSPNGEKQSDPKKIGIVFLTPDKSLLICFDRRMLQ